MRQCDTFRANFQKRHDYQVACQQQVMGLVASGFSNREIAAARGTSEQNVKNILRGLYKKIGVRNRVELLMWRLSRRNNARTELV